MFAKKIIFFTVLMLATHTSTMFCPSPANPEDMKQVSSVQQSNDNSLFYENDTNNALALTIGMNRHLAEQLAKQELLKEEQKKAAAAQPTTTKTIMNSLLEKTCIIN
ncbi:MAG: hypothetical protein NTX86_03205 [Candidatus Dependentiae bacterium]|nr:hypothetical protein [Candidatus Dependentiae bacterium]